MNVMINLPEDVADILARRAKQEGQELSGYLEELAAREAEAMNGDPFSPEETAEEGAEDFLRWARSQGKTGRALSPESVARASFYDASGSLGWIEAV
jgi:hypothetical protein